MLFERDYYQTLGVSRDADLDTIKQAYRRAAKSLHPDASSDQNGAAFSDLSEAYEALRDSSRRRAYDQRLRSSEGVSTPSRWVPDNELDKFAVDLGWGLSNLFDLFGGVVGAVRWWDSGVRLSTDVAMDLELSPGEAASGVAFPIEISERDLRPAEYTPMWSSTPFSLTINVAVPAGVRHGWALRHRFIDGDGAARMLQITVRIV